MSIKLGLLVFVMAFILSACSGGAVRDDFDVNLKQASDLNVRLGLGYLKRGQYKVAQEKLLKAIKQDADNIDAYTSMAYLLMQLNKPEEAEEYYIDALDIKENNPELNNGYATYLCRAGRIDDALEQFKLAYTNPYYKTAYLAYSNAGTCLLQAKKYAQAETMLRHALKIQPKLSGALISMSELSIKTRKYMSARAYIQRYHAVTKPSAESLWLQIQIERALAAKDLYKKYERQLLDEFADSQQAGWVKELAHRDRIRKR